MQEGGVCSSFSFFLFFFFFFLLVLSESRRPYFGWPCWSVGEDNGYFQKPTAVVEAAAEPLTKPFGLYLAG